MDERDEALAYLKKMQEAKGYVFESHKILAAEDFEFLKAYNTASEAGYTKEHLLDKKTKELLFTAILIAKNSTQGHIKTHMNLAIKYGATKQELLEVLELCWCPCGAMAFLWGFDAWKDVVNPESIDI